MNVTDSGNADQFVTGRRCYRLWRSSAALGVGVGSAQHREGSSAEVWPSLSVV